MREPLAIDFDRVCQKRRGGVAVGAILVLIGIVIAFAFGYFVLGPAAVAWFLGWSLLNPFLYITALVVLLAFAGGPLLRRIFGLPRLDPDSDGSSIGNSIVDSVFGDQPTNYLFAYIGQALIVGLFIGWAVRIWYLNAPATAIQFLGLIVAVPSVVGLTRGVITGAIDFGGRKNAETPALDALLQRKETEQKSAEAERKSSPPRSALVLKDPPSEHAQLLKDVAARIPRSKFQKAWVVTYPDGSEGAFITRSKARKHSLGSPLKTIRMVLVQNPGSVGADIYRGEFVRFWLVEDGRVTTAGDYSGGVKFGTGQQLERELLRMIGRKQIL